MANSEGNKHVAVFPFPFASHPPLLLSQVVKLANAAPNFQFSFINTDQSNKPLLSKSHIPHNIKFYTISDGVPEGHVLGGHPVEPVNLFLQACPQNLQKGIDMAVAHTKRRVTCVIADALVAPSFTVAQRLNVPWVAFWFALPCSLYAHVHTDLIRSMCKSAEGDTPLDFLPGFSNKIRVEDLPEDVINRAGEEEILFTKTLASLGSVLPQAEAVVVNFYEELDRPLLTNDLRSKFKHFLYLGFFSHSVPPPPLPPSDTDGTGCLSWLDKQKGGSVAYVSLGTMAIPPPHETVALAEALEESGFPFLWSLKEQAMSLLPSGFLERTSGRGKVVAWAPQAHVLGHGSVGVFVSHCGSNSVSESMSNGMTMICRPFFGDHVLNGRMAESVWEIGVKVEGGVFTKDGLLKCLRLVLVQEEGKRIKKNAVKVRRAVLDAAGPQGKAAQDFKTLLEVVSRS